MTHSEALAFCIKEADELTGIAEHLLMVHKKRQPFSSVATLYAEGSQRLVPWRTRAVELIRDYRPAAFDDFQKTASYASGHYEQIKHYMTKPSTFDDVFTYFIDEVREMKSVLEMVVVPQVKAAPPAATPSAGDVDQQTVFIVHGHDDAAKTEVARLVEQLGLRAVILHEQASQSRTVVEKLERHSNVSFAVVLLTPDDVGASSEDALHLKPRARQNVVLEMGFFLGKLQRSRVCTLYKEDVELPSDWTGVVYVPLDKAGRWKFELAKELRAAGLAADLNRL
jgi:predicted nucleotide-binding protein